MRKRAWTTGGRQRLQSNSIALECEHDIAVARGEVRSVAAAIGFPLIDQTRLATVASELARNVVDRKSTRLNSSHDQISYAVFCLKKKKKNEQTTMDRTRQRSQPSHHAYTLHPVAL